LLQYTHFLTLLAVKNALPDRVSLYLAIHRDRQTFMLISGGLLHCPIRPINLADITTATASATAFATAYLPNDANGDGTVYALDLILVDNKAANAINAMHP
jgi:hypothetical protein